MLHKKIRIPIESSQEIMEELGKLDDCLQFVDINIGDYNHKKAFEDYIKRCDECLKEINYFENIVFLYGLKMIKYKSYRTFKIDLQNDRDNYKNNISIYFDSKEEEIIKNKKDLEEKIENYKNISQELDLLIEKKSIFVMASNLIFSENYFQENNNDINDIIINNDDSVQKSLIFKSLKDNILLENISNPISKSDFISGVIKAEDNLKFKKMLFRISKGRFTSFFYDLTLENRSLQIQQEKKIFIIIIPNNNINNSYIIKKIINICDIFNANRFIFPLNKEELSKNIAELQQNIFDKKTSLKKVETEIKDFCKSKIGEDGVPGKYDMYKLYFIQERLIFENLNKCKIRKDYFDGEIWIPIDKLDILQNIINKNELNYKNNFSIVLEDFIQTDDDLNLNYYKQPPTYFKLNDFSTPFQMMVNIYGIPRYREINPGLFILITFPFIFGVMFGDIGHGGLLTLLGIWLIIKKYEILNKYKSLTFLLKYRYFILFLGFFAFYNGIIYNQFFSMPLNFFGSCYKKKEIEGEIKLEKKEKDCIYPIGLDPKWYSANNELAFLNSFKMKMSVIIGIIQMILGLVLKGLNLIYFKNYADLFFVFFPQFIFFILLFGYLILMIYIKWSTDWSNDSSKAPSILSQFILIFFDLGSTGPKDNKTPLFHKEDFTYQESLQFYLLIIIISCITIMLLFKPIFEYYKSKNKSFIDLFINQAIETIKYIFYTVSHTASYLRLWALSLAHSQLSKVFFDITLLGNIQDGDIYGMLFGFIIFYHVTLGIIIGIDLLICSLHNLRLHWIEFQSKFFYGDGYIFTPFCFKYICEDID